MIIGVDFDNTLACYDQLFHTIALEQKLITATVPANKTAVRDAMRAEGKEQLWIELQGQVYGRRINEAPAYDGALIFFKQAHVANVTLYIVSHKTKQPASGEDVNLHVAAMQWLERQGFVGSQTGSLSRAQVYFEPTKHAKLARIASLGCDHFIDDLPEFLAEPGFPAATQKWLFDPAHRMEASSKFVGKPCDAATHVVRSWNEMTQRLINARMAV